MESDHRYYWRRASEELHAAARAVTPAARQRRPQLAESYFRKLCDLPARREAELGGLPLNYREDLARGLMTLGALHPEWPIERRLAPAPVSRNKAVSSTLVHCPPRGQLGPVRTWRNR